MSLKFVVQDENKSEVFESDSRLEAEMVGIALAFAGLYQGGRTYLLKEGKTTKDEFDSASASQRLKEKIQYAKFNKRIDEDISDEEINTYIMYQINKGVKHTTIYDRVVSLLEKRRKLVKV